VSRSVLDASAVLALLFKEPGWLEVMGHLPNGMMSAINLCEVMTKSIDAGMPLEDARLVAAGLPCEIVPFDAEQAYLAGNLRAATRPFGLSLGERACLALGAMRGFPVVTAERTWAECDLGVEVIRIR